MSIFCPGAAISQNFSAPGPQFRKTFLPRGREFDYLKKFPGGQPGGDVGDWNLLMLQLTVLCCRRPNKVSCKSHFNTPDISMQTFLKEAKRKQKWMTFARIHRLACQRNNLPCAPSILKHHVSAEVCLLGHQWISRGFTWTLYHGKGSAPSIYAKPKDSLDTDYPRKEGRLVNRFFPRNVLWMFLWYPTLKRQYPKSPSPPPQKKNLFLIRLDRPI